MLISSFVIPTNDKEAPENANITQRVQHNRILQPQLAAIYLINISLPQ